jgi:gamma-glutamyltranspeptidase
LIAKQFPTCLTVVTKQIALFWKEDVKLYDSTIVEKNGKLFMFAMPSGGSTIITSVLQTILNVDEYNLSAVNARFHHQWLPYLITFEPNPFNTKTLKP